MVRSFETEMCMLLKNTHKHENRITRAIKEKSIKSKDNKCPMFTGLAMLTQR